MAQESGRLRGRAEAKGLQDRGIALPRRRVREGEERGLRVEAHSRVVRVQQFPFLATELHHLRAQIHERNARAFLQVVKLAVPPRPRAHLQHMPSCLFRDLSPLPQDPRAAFAEADIAVEALRGGAVDGGDVSVLRQGGRLGGKGLVEVEGVG